MVQISSAADACDAFVDSFEEARQRPGGARLVDFLPPRDHPQFHAVAAELIRVDMEYSWECSATATVDSYREMLPEVLADPEALSTIAFEEYRLRALAGQPVDRAEYGRRFNIATDGWPQFGHVLESEQSSSHFTGHSVGIERAWAEALELTDNLTEFPGVGQAFAGFELQEELGRGAFARVYLARQKELADRPVVLKVAAGKSLEPQHLARLQHTNIVPIYSVHEVGQCTAVCMPYFGPRTLADVIGVVAAEKRLPASGAALLSTVRNAADATLSLPQRRNRPAVSGAKFAATPTDAPPLEQLQECTWVDAVLDVIRQLAEGLAHAHARGIVHRDLKPANILLTEDGRPLLLDFNLSEDVVVHGRPSLMMGGTLPYMSPEQLHAVRTGGQIDARSDLYSLGAIFYELLAGRRPFADRRGSFDETIEQMVTDRTAPPPLLRSVNPAVPPSVQAIVARCLTTDVAQRYQSADELVEDLQRQRNNRPLRFAANASVAERVAKWSRRHPRASSGGTIAAVAAVVLAIAAAVGVRWSAEHTYQQFTAELPAIRAGLTVAEPDVQLIEQGIARGKSTLAAYGVISDSSWLPAWSSWALPTDKAAKMSANAGELAYLLAETTARLAVLDGSAETRMAAGRWNEIAAAAFGDDLPQAVIIQRATIARLDVERGDIRERDARRLVVDDSDPARQTLLDLRLTATRLLGQREFRAAMPFLQSLRDRAPQDAAAWLMLGNAYAALADHAQAEICYDAAKALLPRAGAYVALLNRGLNRLHERDHAGAIADFSQVLQRRPNLVCGYLNRGLAYAALQQHRAAVADYTRALELGATQTRIYFLRSRSFLALGEREQARIDYKTGLEQTPTDELSWIARGVARLPRDPAAALDDFRAALRLAPHSLVALQNIYHVTADRLALYDDARAALNGVLAMQPDNASALAGRAVLSAREGDRAAALTDLERLLRMSQGPVHQFQAACVLSLTSAEMPADADRAFAHLAKAILAAPELAERANSDPDLANLRQAARFDEVLETAVGTGSTPNRFLSSPAQLQ